MTQSQSASHTYPGTRERAIDRYFLEHRAKLLDIAAFLDRVDRAAPEAPPEAGEPEADYRLRAMRRAIEVLTDGQPERARRIQEIFSDPTDEPVASAANLKGAAGAYDERSA